jgi:putative ABC transport system permease protein
MSGFYTLPEWKPAYDASFYAVGAALVSLSAAVSWLACGRLLEGVPAEALRPKAPKTFRHGMLERSKLWGRLGFNAQWNIRDTARNRLRLLMAVIGVFGCTALVICALSMNDSMESVKAWQYDTINRYESKLALAGDVTPERAAAIADEVSGEAIMEAQVELRAGGERKNAALLVTDGMSLLGLTDVNLQAVKLPEGLSITRMMADLLNVRAGDTIELRVYGEQDWISCEIAAIYREPINQGIAMERAFFESLGMKFRPTAVLSASRAEAGIDGAVSIQSAADGVKGWESLTQAMYMMIYLLIAAAAVLSVVVLYNLGLLSFTEMEREIATLKVIGLKTRKLRGLLLTQNLWFSGAGFVLGVPGGLWLTYIMIEFAAESFDFPISLEIQTLIIAFLFTFGLSVLVNLLFSRKIRRINMVEALKAVE